MITYLNGTLIEGLPDRVVVDVQGMGYEVLIPVSTYDQLPAVGRKVRLLTHFHVREQEQSLYGFFSTEERDLFRLLIQRVSGVGPKLGMAILSGMGVAAFKSNVVNGDVTALSKISGLGKKTAERVVVELKDKVGVADAWEASSAGGGQVEANDAVLALISLGYKQVEAQKAVKSVLDGRSDVSADELVRDALRRLS